MTCDPGTRPTAGNSKCVPVGTTTVPDGFAPDGPWGFHPVLPPGCTGATIATLGATKCAPIDDCSAAFPPADADIAVNATGAAYASRPGLPVATTLADALAKVPKGGTIAVDGGTFELPPTIDVSTNIVGRCAGKTLLDGTGFGVHVVSAIQVKLSSLAIVGSPKVALLIDSDGTVDLDHVYVHGDNDGAEVGNGATLDVSHSVFEGPPSAHSATFATTGLHAVYAGNISLDAVEVRGYQLALFAQSTGTHVVVKGSVLHEQPQLSAAMEGLSTLGAFLGAKVEVDRSYLESTPGRIAMVGAARLDGAPDPTSPGNPPATVVVTNSSLVQALMSRDKSSAIDVVDGATLDLQNVTLHHDSFVGIGASDSSIVSVKSSVLREAKEVGAIRSALSGLSGAAFTVDSSALVGSSEGAIVLDKGSSLSMNGSLVADNREVGVNDPTTFLGAGQALTIAPGGRADITDSAFVDNQDTALFVQGGTVNADSVVFTGTHPSNLGPYSAAVTAVNGAVVLKSSLLGSNDRALALQGGRALVRDGVVIDEKEAFRLDGLAFVKTENPVNQAVASELIAARTAFARDAVLVTHKPLTAE